MLLLTLSYDTLGVDNPDSMRIWANNISARFPDSPWAKFAQEAVVKNEKAHKVKMHEAALLAKYERPLQNSFERGVEIKV